MILTSRRICVLIGALCTAASPLSGQTHPSTPRGFATTALDRQDFCEARLLALPTPAQWREHHRRITMEPHPTGSEAQRRVGRYLAEVMERAGFEVDRAAYDVYLPVLEGLVNEIEIVAPERIRLENREPALEADPFSSHPDLLPGWNAFSGSGDVTGEVVYANFGRKEDFEALDSMGVAVRGKVVVARYGGNFRGFKVKFAEERGAAAVVLFNDPGFAPGGEYPDGPQMSDGTIQRGSVLTQAWTGDPLTPFEPALPLDGDTPVRRLHPDSVGLHRIPALPIGYGAAREILSRMEGEDAPAGWGGGIDVPYRITGGPRLALRVRVRQDLDFVRAENIIGTLRGSEFPDEWVILGAHYDPWSFGAHDPNGGTSTLLTLAEALGTLAREGCRPRRSILIAHWDAEEYGIIGSSEWVEHHRADLERNAVAYINADAAVTGPTFSAASSPSLKGPLLEAAGAVGYPGLDATVLERWTATGRAATAREGSDPTPSIGNLGGGSDHVGFYTHAGIPSAGPGFGGSNGIYHSNYDTFAFFERFSDPEFRFGPALARLDGILALRLANAEVLPYDLARYGTDTEAHARDLERRAAELGLEGVSLARLREASLRLAGSAREWERAVAERLAGAPIAAEEARAINATLRSLEKAFLHPEGLQGRAWSRSLYASPDPFSGYASWMLPGIRYEIETRNREGIPLWEERAIAAVEQVEREVRLLSRRIRRAPAKASDPDAARD